MYQHFNAQPEPPSKYNARIPSQLDAVILRALAKKPQGRYTSIAQFAQAFHWATGSQKSANKKNEKQELYTTTTISDSTSADKTSNKSTRSIMRGGRPLARINATFLLYIIAAVVVGFLVGIVLNGMGKLPSYIVNIAASLGTVLALFSGLVGGFVEKSFPKGIWKNANRPFAILASIVTIMLLVVPVELTLPPKPNNNQLLGLSTGITPPISSSPTTGITQTNSITVTPVVSSPTPTPTSPPPVSFPPLAGSYLGQATNQNSNHRSNISLTNVAQNQGNIGGYFKFGLPLFGSGPFTGTISSSGVVQFTVNSNDGSNASLTFSGSFNSNDSSMNGTYTVSDGESGHWQVAPDNSPVVYPYPYSSYSGSYINRANGFQGVLAFSVSSYSNTDGTISGTLSATGEGSGPFTGNVGSDNRIAFTFTPANTNLPPVTFNGTIAANSSMGGTYSIQANTAGT